MSTLHLVVPAYREVVGAIPAFDYDAQPLSDIRSAVAAVYTQTYGPPEAVNKDVINVSGWQGAPGVRALLYKPRQSSDFSPAILHIHGGAWIAGSPDMLAAFCAGIAERHGAVVLSVDYRLAPETPFPGPLDDCYAALAWLHEHAAEVGIDPTRISVLGDSAGGNLAAGLALRARDEGRYPLRAQLLIYPALDDRTGGPDALVDNPTAGEFVITREYMRAVWKARTEGSELAAAALTSFSPSRAADLWACRRPTSLSAASTFSSTRTWIMRSGSPGLPFQLSCMSMTAYSTGSTLSRVM